MSQLEHIEAIEKRLWSAADTLRANSGYASNEYFLPVMGLVFLRHAYSRYLAVKDQIVADMPTRGGKKREPTKEDFLQRSAILLRPEAQFDYLVGLPDGEDRAKAIIGAMESIEADYSNLQGILPKNEYQELSNDVLGQLLRTLNPDIGDMATFCRGNSYRDSDLCDGGGKDFVNLKCIQRFGGFRASGLKRFEGKHREHHLIKAGDIVIAVTDMTREAMIVAQAAKIPKSISDGAIFSMDLVKVVPRPGIDPNWLYLLFRYSGFSYAVREYATGTNVLHLKPKYIEQWDTPLPPTTLRNTFSEIVRPILAQQDEFELQYNELIRARDLLLPRLMTGEITV